MWKINKDLCIGCGICTLQCNGIQMQQGVAKITDDSAPCLSLAAQVCPRRIIVEI
ncbi:MAG: 4Fe-4S binding protein [Promethearchaeota archaeon]